MGSMKRLFSSDERPAHLRGDVEEGQPTRML
jgi:hypothetical protein